MAFPEVVIVMCSRSRLMSSVELASSLPRILSRVPGLLLPTAVGGESTRVNQNEQADSRLRRYPFSLRFMVFRCFGFSRGFLCARFGPQGTADRSACIKEKT